MNRTKVSVCMITYGQESFISEAIEGVLRQKVNFSVELIVANDCSPDNTDDIIRNIILKHPKAHIIKYMKQDQNIGVMPNFIEAVKKCSGEYIAFCEGDDYWIDEYKLQKQVDILEGNLTLSGVATGYQIVNIEGSLLNVHKSLPFGIKYIETKHLLQKNLMATCTVMLRNNFAKTEKDYNFLRCQMLGDLSTWLLSSLNGPIYFIPDVTAAYRNGVGISANFNQLKHAKLSIETRTQFLSEYPQPRINKLSFICAKPYYLNNYSEKLAKHGKKLAASIEITKAILLLPLMWLNPKRLQNLKLRVIIKTFKAIILK